MSENFDIVIVGAGPTGLMLAACITRMGPYKIKIIDKRTDPTQIGRADGIQARTLDHFRNMSLKRPIMAYDPFRIYEVAFWNPSESGRGIQRSGTWTSYPDFIDTRYHFTTILHQGRIEKVFLDDLSRASVTIDRPCTIAGFRKDGRDGAYPVEVDLIYPDRKLTVRTKYLFGADGAKSVVREKLGIPMPLRDPITFVWSVIDGQVRTTFPDISIKCTVHSEAGSSMVIPQGHNRVRIYIQVRMDDPNADPWKEIDQAGTQRLANRIFSPYTIEWEEVDWWSVYPIGQRVAERYTLDERIFIGGDACHTHSPKAGQGMNYGFFDAQNFSWKLHLVESGFAARSLLESYEQERRLAATRLIDFDIQYAKLFSSKFEELKSAANSLSADEATREDDFIRYFKKASSFVSGYEVDYGANALNRRQDVSPTPSLASGKLTPGRVFPLANVVRVVDAHVCHLEQEIPFNGSYRIYVFAGDGSKNHGAVADLAAALGHPDSFLKARSRDVNETAYQDRHNPHSPFFSFCLIYNNARASIEIDDALPGFFAPYRHHLYSDSCLQAGYGSARGLVHDKMGFDKERGGVAIVRPDAFTACTLSLDDGAATARGINQYFMLLSSGLGNPSPKI